ncbi:MAG: M55 family metallopeptidase [Pseudomonadota bacterium]
MKVFISVDMEGVSGLVRWADVTPGGIDFELNRSLMTADANAAVEGAFNAGATEVTVEENHGVEDLCVLKMDEIDPRCRVVRGAGRPGSSTMAGLDETCDLVMLVGHHARAGSFPGIMAHTISYTEFSLVSLSGEPVGEADFFVRRAAELSIPVGLITGDQIVAKQVEQLCPNIEQVIVKEALGRQAGDCIPPVRARAMIREGASRAVQRAINRDLGVFEAHRPHEFEVTLRKPANDAMTENLASLAEFEVLNSTLIRVAADHIELGFRRVAYLGYARRAGATKY